MTPMKLKLTLNLKGKLVSKSEPLRVAKYLLGNEDFYSMHPLRWYSKPPHLLDIFDVIYPDEKILMDLTR
jgi:hypothetical protein